MRRDAGASQAVELGTHGVDLFAELRQGSTQRWRQLDAVALQSPHAVMQVGMAGREVAGSALEVVLVASERDRVAGNSGVMFGRGHFHLLLTETVTSTAQYEHAWSRPSADRHVGSVVNYDLRRGRPRGIGVPALASPRRRSPPGQQRPVCRRGMDGARRSDRDAGSCVRTLRPPAAAPERSDMMTTSIQRFPRTGRSHVKRRGPARHGRRGGVA